MMESLALIVTTLDTTPKLEAHLTSIMQKCAINNLSFNDCDHIGKAVVWAIGHCLDKGFTAPTESAWKSLHIMILTILRPSI